MADDDIASKLVLPTRDQEADFYRRDYRIRVPLADTSDGTQPFIDSCVHADRMDPAYANALALANNTDITKRSTPELYKYARSVGLQNVPQAASGAEGEVTISASVGGTTLYAGDEGKTPGGIKVAVNVGRTYGDGDRVGVTAVDTGPQTNLAPGTLIKWTQPRPGCGPQAYVVRQADGSGLSGGRNEESPAELIERTRQHMSEAAGAGNDAQIIQQVEEKTGLAVLKCFTIAALLGPGSTSVVFLMRPQRPGGSRVPNPAQRALVQANLSAFFPKDMMIVVSELAAIPVDVVLTVGWANKPRGWLDALPWPPTCNPAHPVRVTAVTSASAFTLGSGGGSYPPPTPNKTIAFFDARQGTFARKRLVTVTGTDPWVVTCDTSNDATNTAYTPVVGDLPCPFSASLDALVAAVAQYFDELGPGEQKADPFDAGGRQKRYPFAPGEWPHDITTLLSTRVQASGQVTAAGVLLPALPLECPVIGAGISNVFELGRLAFVP
jgi:hypothetical protein